MQKNVAGQTFYIFAYDTVNNVPKTGDAANITVRRSLDGGANSAISGNPTELDSTNSKGVYVVSPAQGDTNGNSIAYTATSTTSGIQIDPIFYQTEAPNNNKLGIDSSGNLTGSVASVVGAVGSVTGAVGSVTGNVGGNVVGSVGSVVSAVTLSAGDSPVMQSGTAAAGGGSTITIATALGADNLPNGCVIKITSGTGADQARIITGYVNSTKVVTVDRAWTTNPDSTSVYSILYADLAATNSSLQIVSSSVQGNVTGSVGSVTGSVGSVTGAVGSVTGNVGGNVVGSVGSLTTNNDKTGYRLIYEQRNGTAQAGAAGSITLDSGASATDHFYEGCWIEISSGTGANQGARLISAYVGATKVATVVPNWTTTPDSTSVFTVLPATQVSGVNGNVTGNITGNLSGSVGSVTGAVGSVTGAVGSVTGNVGGNVVGSVASVAGAVGSVTGSVGSVAGSVSGDVQGKVLGGGSSTITGDGVRAASVTGAVGSVTGAVGSVTGSVGSVVAGVSLASSGLDSVLIESGIVASSSLTNDSGSQLTSINARQALSLVTSAAAAGVLAGAATSTVTMKPAGLPSGNTRVTATCDANGNRSALSLVVPT